MWENVEKYCSVRLATDNNMKYVPYIWIRKATNTHSEYEMSFIRGLTLR